MLGVAQRVAEPLGETGKTADSPVPVSNSQLVAYAQISGCPNKARKPVRT